MDVARRWAPRENFNYLAGVVLDSYRFLMERLERRVFEPVGEVRKSVLSSRMRLLLILISEATVASDG